MFWLVGLEEDGDADSDAGTALVFGQQMREPTPSESFRQDGYLNFRSLRSCD